MAKLKLIQVFEHQRLFKNNTYDGVRFEDRYFSALLKLNELHNSKYFTPIYEGIKFDSYVGVLQVDDLVIEVLPKVEGSTAENNQWRDVLIEMLQVTHQLKVNQLGQASVAKQSIHLLDIYFDWFLTEVEQLVHAGLIKQYRKETKNTLALKGKLEFAGHIRKNLVHQERFYTMHQVYDTDHVLHQVMNEALQVVETMSKGTYRYGHCKAVQLNFPEVGALAVVAQTFEKINFNRKNQAYKTVIALARLIILNYSPNVKHGDEQMLALMFDMNDLWEKYVLAKLQQQANQEWLVKGQDSKQFWERKTMRPDIVLKHISSGETIIIDTKWKNYAYDRIGMDDLRQIYVYNEFWEAKVGMLLYPSPKESKIVVKGTYARNGYLGRIALVTVLDEKGRLDKNLGKKVFMMIEDSLSVNQ
ncbi:McrC family protein [Pedobacter namyangjuensis]|uniref:McrC family protein n=1 Tax=Pedobacter namyangjuensis TaxID=600626 RepID=UPI0013B3D11D|nr:restriction endonuclease [Pedobacter namyangjuensis]